MKWFGISGSWRINNLEVRKNLPEGIRKKIEKVRLDVTKDVKKIIQTGNGIITGGALGVDYYATEVVLKYGNPATQLRIYLPIKLDDFCNHYFRRANEGVITHKQAEMIVSLLKKVRDISDKCIKDDWEWEKANTESYYGRNTFIVENADELYIYHVNETKGTQDVIDKAIRMKKPVHIKKYDI